MYKILFVCAGNTCRSPMASIIFNKKIKDLAISGVSSKSAGLSVTEENLMPQTKSVLKDYGVKRITQKPTQITINHLAENSIIICLTDDIKETLQISVPEKFAQKIYSFKDFCGENISDPYGGDIGIYKRCLSQIEFGIDRIIEVLLGNGIAKQRKSKSV